MRAYNVEVFRLRSSGGVFVAPYTAIANFTIDTLTYSFDYFNRSNNTVEIPYNAEVRKRDMVSVSLFDNAKVRYNGFITDIDYSGTMMKLTFSSFVQTYCDHNVAVKTTDQHSGFELEYVLFELIDNSIWHAGYDATLGFIRADQLTTEVPQWGFNLKPDVEGYNRGTMGLLNVLNRSGQEYNVFVNEVLQFEPTASLSPAYHLQIAHITGTPKIIETSAPYVLSSNVRIEENQNAINRMGMFDSKNNQAGESLYGLFDDGTIGFVDDYPTKTLVQPPVYTEMIISYGDEETFEQIAQREAESQMKKEAANNLIEIEIPIDTETVDYLTWKWGQPVYIVHEGQKIYSVFTGIKIGKTATLVFGTIRKELTKRLRRN